MHFAIQGRGCTRQLAKGYLQVAAVSEQTYCYSLNAVAVAVAVAVAADVVILAIVTS